MKTTEEKIMENNLIYLNGEYYLLSDEEIKEDDWYLNANGIFECDNLHSGTHEQNFSLKNENNLLKWNTKILASTSREKEFNNFLLLSNIEEVIGVVDVERLTEEDVWYDDPKTKTEVFMIKQGYIRGFNKALSLNKHKMFTEEQMVKAIEFGYELRMYKSKVEDSNVKAFIASLAKPQTSWKVKIVKEENGIITIQKA